MPDAFLRRFARDQWLRINGTPRVTVLVGGIRARTMWQQWLRVVTLDGVLLDGELDGAVREATTRAIAGPTTPIAVLCELTALRDWRLGRSDRIAAMVDDGLVEIPDEAVANLVATSNKTKRPRARRRTNQFDARSAAEAALYEALEATPPTAGRFELNGYLSVRSGADAAEVDLIARKDRIAIEIDGFYHFTDPSAYRRDRRKDLLLQTQGLLVIRVLAQDVMQDARPAVAAVCEALAHRMS
jgi:very-short-patch-repair endonuclease